MQFAVTLTRKVGQRTNDEIIQKQVEKIINLALKGTRGKNWQYSIARAVDPTQDNAGLWVFYRKVTFKNS